MFSFLFFVLEHTPPPDRGYHWSQNLLRQSMPLVKFLDGVPHPCNQAGFKQSRYQRWNRPTLETELRGLNTFPSPRIHEGGGCAYNNIAQRTDGEASHHSPAVVISHPCACRCSSSGLPSESELPSMHEGFECLGKIVVTFRVGETHIHSPRRKSRRWAPRTVDVPEGSCVSTVDVSAVGCVYYWTSQRERGKLQAGVLGTLNKEGASASLPKSCHLISSCLFAAHSPIHTNLMFLWL